MKRELFIVAIALWLLPAATAFGQELRKEKLKGTTGGTEVNYAVFIPSVCLKAPSGH